MLQAGKTLSRTIALWESLRDAVKVHIDELPHAADDLEKLDQAIALIRELAAEQDQLTGRQLELTRLRKEAEDTGRRARNRLAGHVQGHYGPDSERLYEFGLKPRITRRRRATEEESQEQDAPPSP